MWYFLGGVVVGIVLTIVALLIMLAVAGRHDDRFP